MDQVFRNVLSRSNQGRAFFVPPMFFQGVCQGCTSGVFRKKVGLQGAPPLRRMTPKNGRRPCAHAAFVPCAVRPNPMNLLQTWTSAVPHAPQFIHNSKSNAPNRDETMHRSANGASPSHNCTNTRHACNHFKANLRRRKNEVRSVLQYHTAMLGFDYSASQQHGPTKGARRGVFSARVSFAG